MYTTFSFIEVFELHCLLCQACTLNVLFSPMKSVSKVVQLGGVPSLFGVESQCILNGVSLQLQETVSVLNRENCTRLQESLYSAPMLPVCAARSVVYLFVSFTFGFAPLCTRITLLLIVLSPQQHEEGSFHHEETCYVGVVAPACSRS